MEIRWKHPQDDRQRCFKVIDLLSAQLFMKDALQNDNTYTVPDVYEPGVFHILQKVDDLVSIGQARLTDSDLLDPFIREFDDVDDKIYRVRKSINAKFFKELD